MGYLFEVRSYCFWNNKVVNSKDCLTTVKLHLYISYSCKDFLKITKNVKHYLNADHKKLERFFKKNNQTTFILNKYIINPLLFKEKKFHIRIYLINYINSKNIIKSYLSRYGKIITAKDKYIPADFGNKDIHDSHIKSTDNDYMFPNDLEKEYGKTKVHNYFNQIKIINLITYCFVIFYT